MKKRDKKLGFTLVELLISISIIAILSVVLAVSFSNAQKNGRDQRRIADLKAIQGAAEQMILLTGNYPPLEVSYKENSAPWKVNDQVVLQSYPIDPKNTGVFVYTAQNISSSGYCVCAKVENYKYGNSEGINCAITPAAINNCKLMPDSCYFCVKNQQ